MILWVVGLLTVAESGGADPYSVMHLATAQGGGYGSRSYLDTTYRAIRWIGSVELEADEEHPKAEGNRSVLW